MEKTSTIKSYVLKQFGSLKLESVAESGAAPELSQAACLLLSYLAEHEQVNRDELARLFYEDVDEESSRKGLRNLLYSIRQSLPEIIVSTGDYLSLQNIQTESTTLAELESSHDLKDLEKARVIYKGDYLAKVELFDSFELQDWLETTRRHWQERYIKILTRLLSQYLETQNYKDAVDVAKEWLGFAPWQEEAHRQLMRAYAFLGERSLVVLQYQKCQEVLAEELGLAPDPQTQTLYQNLLIG